jgi:tetrahydromethanopterin S-methyltransferase subunit B
MRGARRHWSTARGGASRFFWGVAIGLAIAGAVAFVAQIGGLD